MKCVVKLSVYKALHLFIRYEENIAKWRRHLQNLVVNNTETEKQPKIEPIQLLLLI